MTGRETVVVGSGTQRKLTWIKIDIRAYTMIAALLLIWIFFGLMTDAFLSTRNLSNLFLQMSVTSILAIGMVLVIVAGQIDLSVGSIVGLTGGVAAILNVWYDWGTIPVIIATVIVGAVIGLFQGWIVAYQAVPAFIVTLAGMLIFRGVLLGITDSVTVSPLSEDLRFIGQSYVNFNAGYLLAIFAFIIIVYLQVRRRQSRVKYGFQVAPYYMLFGQIVMYAVFIGGFVYLMNDYKGIPVPFILVIILGIIFTFIAKNTIFGRHIYALGGNSDAAALSGINIKRRILLVFVLCNTLAAIAGLVYTSRLNAATSGAGEMYELDAIAACVIGGTSLMGGIGTISGAVIGALVMASLDNGMSIMNIESFWQQIVKGSILVIAVWVDIYTRKRSKKS